MSKNYRLNRIAQEIKKNIAIIIQQNIFDYRINNINILDVKISKDLSQAKIFINFLHNLDLLKIKIRLKILEHAVKFIRIKLSKLMYIKFVPNIIFIYDDTYIKGDYICNLINRTLNN